MQTASSDRNRRLDLLQYVSTVLFLATYWFDATFANGAHRSSYAVMGFVLLAGWGLFVFRRVVLRP